MLSIKRQKYLDDNCEMISIVDDTRNPATTIARLQKGVTNGIVHTQKWVILYWPIAEHGRVGTVVFESKDKEEALREMLDAFGLEE